MSKKKGNNKYKTSDINEVKYKQGTINGIKVGSKSYSKKKKQKDEYKSLVKILCCAVCILIMVFVLNALIRENFTFNGIYYEEPKDNEVIEIVSSSNADEPPERVSLNLKGDLVIDLKMGDDYVEPGYMATSDLKGDITSYVKVTGKVDTGKAGTYKLTYTLDYRGISPKLTRLINVKDSSSNSKPSPSTDASSSPEPSSSPSLEPSVTPSPSSSPNPLPSPSPIPEVGNITLTLRGDATVYVVEGSQYNDEGAKAVDNKGNDVSSQITKTGSVNTNVAGTYKITYSITNYNGQVLTVVRNVVVQNMEIRLTLSNNNYTNDHVNILVVTNVDQFSNIVLPSGEKVTSKTYTYKVTKNGTYEFIVYNQNGAYRKASMVITNIDKEKPRGRCVITHQGNGSIVTVTATDNTGIASYYYSGDHYMTNIIPFARRIDSGIQINIGFYDLAGNYSNCTCIAP